MSCAAESVVASPAAGKKSAAGAWSPTKALASICVAEFGAMMNFYILFSVAPIHAARMHGSVIQLGLVTTALMFAAAIAEVSMGWLSARIECRRLFCLGLAIFSATAALMCFTTNIEQILLVCAVRGVALGMILVTGSSLVAYVVPASRRSAAIGVYGIVSGIPAVIALPLCPWLIAHVGATPAFICGGLLGLVGLAFVSNIPKRVTQSHDRNGIALPEGLRVMGIPLLLLLAVSMAAGAVTTFLPLITPNSSPNLLTLALFCYAIAAIVCRGIAGALGNSRRQRRLCLLGVSAALTGLCVFAWRDDFAAIAVGMLLIGAGFGVVQNASLSWMLDTTTQSGHDTLSAAWNLAYDSGLGMGAAILGAVAGRSGYAFAFIILAVLVAISLLIGYTRHAGPRKSTNRF
jgi:predicted MFS family arabinose efflux permease